MDELFTLHPNGLFLRWEALEHGYRDRDLAAARRAGIIVRVRHGAYVPRATWAKADEVGRHRLRSQAVLLTHGNNVALSHTSGAAEHGLRLWKPDLTKVHVTRLDNMSGRRLSDVVYHADSWHPDDVFAKDEGLVVSEPRDLRPRRSIPDHRRARQSPILDSLFDLKLRRRRTSLMRHLQATRVALAPLAQRLQV